MTKREKILMAYKNDPKFNRAEFAREIGCCKTYVTDILRQSRKANPNAFLDMATDDGKHFLETPSARSERVQGQVAEVTESLDEMLVETKGADIRTAEQSMEYCGVNAEEWEITKKVINFWDMGKKRNWQVKVWLKRKSELDANAAIDRLIKRLPKFKYSKFKPLAISSKKNSGNLGVICNFDAHMGKLAWDVETGQGDFDLPISEREYDYVTDTNLSRISPYNPEKMIFILGQDMLHYENLEGVTPKGRNILDTDGRLAKLQDMAIDVCVRNILKCRALAPVDVILVQGNHDQTSSLWLSKVLRAWFKDDPYVDIDCAPKLRKAILWGKTFLGLAHRIPPGKIAAAHAEFSTAKDMKKMWGEAEYREILFGDQHRKMQWKIGSQITHGACLFRQLTALSKIDYWHYENFFTDAVPGGEAFVYNKLTGCSANFTEWTYHLKDGK